MWCCWLQTQHSLPKHQPILVLPFTPHPCTTSSPGLTALGALGHTAAFSSSPLGHHLNSYADLSLSPTSIPAKSLPDPNGAEPSASQPCVIQVPQLCLIPTSHPTISSVFNLPPLSHPQRHRSIIAFPDPQDSLSNKFPASILYPYLIWFIHNVARAIF